MMTLEQLIGEAIGLPSHVGNIEASGLKLDSRAVTTGDIFIARQGSVKHGQAFIEHAIAKGAVAILVEGKESELLTVEPVPVIQVLALSQQLGRLAAKFYQTTATPAVIGVTGTNGKTSVCHYFAAIMSACGEKTAVMGTVGSGVWPALQQSELTTPDVCTQHASLAGFRQQDVKYVAEEISSHALDQDRVAYVPVNIAVFTNLSQDHLDYHGTMEAYGAAKAKLFQLPTVTHAVVNVDDPFGRQICEQLPSDCQVLTYSMTADAEASLRISRYQATAHGIQATLTTTDGDLALDLPLLGDFTLANIMASIGGCLAAGMPLEKVQQGVAAIKAVCGRMEWLQNKGGAQVVIDFAHTPDALSRALSNLRPLCRGQLWCVFGCGGDRDREKRPLMGQAAADLADQIVLTSDNPRTENPEQIMAEISAGTLGEVTVKHIEDRHQAIHYAVQQANADDWILVAGKGHETYQEIHGQRFDMHDQDIALAAIAAERENKR